MKQHVKLMRHTHEFLSQDGVCLFPPDSPMELARDNEGNEVDWASPKVWAWSIIGALYLQAYKHGFAERVVTKARKALTAMIIWRGYRYREMGDTLAGFGASEDTEHIDVLDLLWDTINTETEKTA